LLHSFPAPAMPALFVPFAASTTAPPTPFLARACTPTALLVAVKLALSALDLFLLELLLPLSFPIPVSPAELLAAAAADAATATTTATAATAAATVAAETKRTISCIFEYAEGLSSSFRGRFRISGKCRFGWI
jgi:hypothetical protein